MNGKILHLSQDMRLRGYLKIRGRQNDDLALEFMESFQLKIMNIYKQGNLAVSQVGQIKWNCVKDIRERQVFVGGEKRSRCFNCSSPTNEIFSIARDKTHTFNLSFFLISIDDFTEMLHSANPHHVILLPWISLTLCRQQSLSSIAPGRSSRLHHLSAQSYCR